MIKVGQHVRVSNPYISTVGRINRETKTLFCVLIFGIEVRFKKSSLIEYGTKLGLKCKITLSVKNEIPASNIETIINRDDILCAVERNGKLSFVLDSCTFKTDNILDKIDVSLVYDLYEILFDGDKKDSFIVGFSRRGFYVGYKSDALSNSDNIAAITFGDKKTPNILINDNLNHNY